MDGGKKIWKQIEIPFDCHVLFLFFSTKLNVREGIFPSTFRQGLHSTQNVRQLPSLVRIRAQPRLPIIVLEVTTASLGSLPVPFTEHIYIYIKLRPRYTSKTGTAERERSEQASRERLRSPPTLLPPFIQPAVFITY